MCERGVSEAPAAKARRMSCTEPGEELSLINVRMLSCTTCQVVRMLYVTDLHRRVRSALPWSPAQPASSTTDVALHAATPAHQGQANVAGRDDAKLVRAAGALQVVVGRERSSCAWPHVVPVCQMSSCVACDEVAAHNPQ